MMLRRAFLPRVRLETTLPSVLKRSFQTARLRGSCCAFTQDPRFLFLEGVSQ